MRMHAITIAGFLALSLSSFDSAAQVPTVHWVSGVAFQAVVGSQTSRVTHVSGGVHGTSVTISGTQVVAEANRLDWETLPSTFQAYLSYSGDTVSNITCTLFSYSTTGVLLGTSGNVSTPCHGSSTILMDIFPPDFQQASYQNVVCTLPTNCTILGMYVAPYYN